MVKPIQSYASTNLFSYIEAGEQKERSCQTEDAHLPPLPSQIHPLYGVQPAGVHPTPGRVAEIPDKLNVKADHSIYKRADYNCN